VKAGEKAADVPPVQADGHVWKLRTTCALLVMWAVVCVACLAVLVQAEPSPARPQTWSLSALVAALGGLIGGVARALYFFSFDSYAFNHKLRTGKSSQWALRLCKELDDDFDPLWVWYLWCLKPVVGAMTGLVLALAIELGLLSLGAGSNAQVDRNLRLLVLGGISGFFSERVFEYMRSMSKRNSTEK
jgi:hypothetical protein